MRPVAAIARAGLVAAVRDRWFLAIAGAFSVLALATSSLVLAGAEVAGVPVFDRTAAGLIGLTLLFVPLLGLTLGAGWVAARRESGALSLLLAHPVTRAQVFAGEYLGAAAAILGAVLVGFGLAGLVLGLRAGAGELPRYAMETGLALGLALSVLGIGFLISVAAPTYGRALGLGALLWLVLVVLSDLATLGVAITARLGAEGMFWLLMANPVDVYRVLAILSIVGSPDLTGPVGTYVVARFGQPGGLCLLTGLLAAWAAAPVVGGMALFSRRREP